LPLLLDRARDKKAIIVNSKIIRLREVVQDIAIFFTVRIGLQLHQQIKEKS